MPKGPNGQKRPADANACAVHVARIATGEVEEDHIRPSGRIRSGQAGAKARSEALGSDQRRLIASAAATARWKRGA